MEIIDFEQIDKSKEPNILAFRKQVEWVAHNYKLSSHAEMQMIRRSPTDNDDLKTRILGSPLFWWTQDKTTKNRCLAIAFNLYTYIVVAINKDDYGQDVPIVITYIDTRSTGSNVFDKLIMDYKAKCREVGV